MYEHILVATDASTHGQKAVDTACALSARLDAQLTVVHVMGQGEVPEAITQLIHSEHLAGPLEIEIRSSAGLGSGVGDLRTIGETGIRRHQMWSALAQRVMADAGDTAERHGVSKLHTTIEEGDPVEELMHAIGERKPDLVVLGRRGVSDLRGLLMGSVSHKLSQLARCDVLTVMSTK